MRVSDILKKRLSRNLSRLSRDVEKNKALEEKDLQSIERLARLIEVAERTEDRPSPRRWPIAVAFLLTLSIVTVLFFARMQTTQVELRIQVSEVRFDLPKRQQIIAETPLSTLSASGLRAVKMPRFNDFDGNVVLGGKRDWTGLSLALSREGGERSRLTLGALTPPIGTRVWVSKTEVPNGFKISLKGNDITITAGVQGDIDTTAYGTETKTLNFGRGRVMRFDASSGVVDVAFTPVSINGLHISKPIEAKNFSFKKTKANIEGGGPVSYSSVLEGEIYLLAIENKKHTLRAGEMLHLASAEGTIRTLELKKDVELTFHGEVSGMTTGTGKNKLSLMPTYLEWWQSHSAWSLLWGTVVYIVGLSAVVIRWVRTGTG